MSSEQRAHPRYAIELDCELLVDERSVRGRTRDISKGGFSMLSPADTATIAGGLPCTVRVSLVFSETEFSEQLTLQGVVMWCTHMKAGTQVGVRFDTLDKTSTGYLDMFMKFLNDGEDPPAEPDDEQP